MSVQVQPVPEHLPQPFGRGGVHEDAQGLGHSHGEDQLRENEDGHRPQAAVPVTSLNRIIDVMTTSLRQLMSHH